MQLRNLTCITLFAFSSGACAAHQFTELDGTAPRPARSPSTVAVFITAPMDQTFHEVGVIEANADSFADAMKRFKNLGGKNGCDAVRAVDNRTHVASTGALTWSITTYVGACLVRVDSPQAVKFKDASSPQAALAAETSDGDQSSHH